MLAYLGMAKFLLSSSITLPVGQPEDVKLANPQPRMPAAAAALRTRWPVHAGAPLPVGLLPPAPGRRRHCEVEKGFRVPALAILPTGLAAFAKMLTDMQVGRGWSTTCDTPKTGVGARRVISRADDEDPRKW